MPRYPQPERSSRPTRQVDPVFIWPVPEEADRMFWVEKDMKSPANRSFTYGDAYSDAVKYPDHKLVYVSPQNEDNISRWFYASDRTSEDAYNFQHASANLGGRKFDAVQRTYLVPRADYSESTPAAGAAMPTDPSGKFPAGYVLADREQRRTGTELDAVYVIETRTYIKRTIITYIGVDPLNGEPLYKNSSFWYRTEIVTGATTAEALFDDYDNAYWGVQENAVQRSGTQISEDWYEIIEEGLIGGAPLDPGASGDILDLGEYETSVNYYWPPVLAELDFKDWERQDGSFETYPFVKFDPDGYRGPCSAVVARSWTRDGQTLLRINPMDPTPIVYSSPGFRLNVPACLHGSISVICDYGTGHPVYAQNVGSAETFAATTFHGGGACTTWPASIVMSDDQRPFRGGYLRETVTVYQPGTGPP